MNRPADEAWRALEAALEAFRRVARKAATVAADPKASRAEADDARHQATFGLAAVGLAFKKALEAARPEDPGSPAPG